MRPTEEIVAAARAAHVHEFISVCRTVTRRRLRKPVRRLSGGERQRLGIARAILKNAPILILDEPTSSLDAISEQIVFDALRRLRHERTTIVIAHRLSTIRDATRILVLDEGPHRRAGDARRAPGVARAVSGGCAPVSPSASRSTNPNSIDELMRAPA